MKRQPRTAEQFITKARGIVLARAATHGTPLQTHSNIAAMWNAHLVVTGRGDARPLSAADVATMLQLMKLVRMQSGRHNIDDDLDNIGYGGILAEVRAATNKRGRK